MTAEGTACNGAGEAPKAEFAAQKAAAAPEEKAPEGEEVGGPFVIVNGDSDGLSDRGSDLGKTPDEDLPSEEEDAPSSPNAAPDAAVAGDHGAAGGELGASGTELGVPSVEERDRAAEKPEGGADEGKGEPVSVLLAEETVQQEAARGDRDGEDALAVAVTGADSDAPVDSEVDGKEGTREETTASDVAELVVHEAAGGEQDGEDADVASCGQDDALTSPTESSSAALESEVCGQNYKEQPVSAGVVEPPEQETGGAGHLMENLHSCADTTADSSEDTAEPESHADESKPEQNEDTAEPESHADESKPEQNASEATIVVERGAACEEQNGMDALQTNGHVLVATGAESKDHVDETKGKETDEQGEGSLTEAEASEGVLEASARNCLGSAEATIEEVDADGRTCPEGSVEEQQAVIDEKVKGEVTCGILRLEDKMEKDYEGSSCEDCTAGIALSNVEAELHMDEGINEAVPAVSDLEEVSESTSQEIVQGDVLVENGVSIGIVDSSKTVSDSAAESIQEQKTQADVSTVDETAAESDLMADNVVGVIAEASLFSQHNCDSTVESVEHEQLEGCGGQANQIKNDVEEAEPKKELEKEIFDAVLSQEAAASSASNFHNEPRSIDLSDSDHIKHSHLATDESECCEHVNTEKSRSREISDTSVDQDGSLEHSSAVADKTELTSETGDKSQQKPSDTAVDQGEPVALNDSQPCSSAGYESAVSNKAVDITKKDKSSDIVGDIKSKEGQSEILNSAATSDECSSTIENNSSSPINGLCIRIGSEDVKVPTTSSVGVVTKCLEASEPPSVDLTLPTEHKDNDGHVCHDDTKIVEDNSGDAQVIIPQKLFMIKVPRFSGEDLWAKIQVAQTRLDQLTQQRDAINRDRLKQKAICDQYREKLETARHQERDARTAHGYKRNDLNSVRSMIGKLNQANSIEEIDEKIAAKENTMQHETISLKEEKLLIKEINELKAQRKQLCSNMGSEAEINEAFDQKDHIHERHKILKKDSDVSFTNLKSLEENTRNIQKAYDDERVVLRKINEDFRAANEIRQKAYRDWSELKALPSQKNQHFFTYKHDLKIADEYRSSGNIYGLQLHCNEQVEKIMGLWNNDENFRKQYVEANKFSTLRRLGTHDGRRFAPDEDPPVIPRKQPVVPSSLTVRSAVATPSSSVQSPTLPTPVSATVKEDAFPVLPSSEISKRIKSKPSGYSAQNEKTDATVLEREDVKQTEKEKARLMEEEQRLARKAEELARHEEKIREEERAAAEKERLRLEQKAKAKEAEERKKRKAEKAQERAEFKARKEAEMKEKKKAKKDKKKGPADSKATSDGNDMGTATADTDSNASDNPRDAEVPQQTSVKRISRPPAVMKQLNRLQPMPEALRNRGKRKMRQYILIGAAILAVLALFVVGNYFSIWNSIGF